MIDRILSHYKITEKLGAGGMGEVYLAEDIKLGRTVALKILPPDLASDVDRMRRFIREAKAASSLDHPNVAQVHEIGEADGIHFIAMQFVQGQTLGARIGGRPLSPTHILNISIQIADALSDAHSKGIVHRDLKPANIMITSREQAKILDFGLARIVRTIDSDEASDLSTMTKTESGIVMGTVAYMSPEQALGQRVDHRSDIFSLGVVLYEMATGRRPFSGKNPMEVVQQITSVQPQAITRFNYDVPPELERLIRKCLEKDPDRRYQSASDLLIDLKNLKRDLDSGILPRETATNVPVRSVQAATPRRISPLIIIAALLGLVLIAGASWFYVNSKKGTAVHSLAVLPFINVNADKKIEYLSDGITESIINNLSQLRQVRVMARGTVFTYKGKEFDPRKVGRDLDVDAVVTGKMVQQGDTLVVVSDLVNVADGSQIWGEQYNRKLSDILNLQTEISKEISEQLRIKLSGEEKKSVTKRYTANPEAYQLYLQGLYSMNLRTEGGHKQAIQYFQKAIDLDPNYALAYAGIADAYTVLGIQGAIGGGAVPSDTMPKAKAAAEEALKMDDTLGEAHVSLGHVLWNYDWNWAAAEEELKKGIDLSPNYTRGHGTYGLFLASKGRVNQAIAERERAQELDPFSIANNMTFGIVLYMTHQYDRALEKLRRTVELGQNMPTPHYYLGLTYLQKGMCQEAIAEMQSSVMLSNRAPLALSGLGYANAMCGKNSEGQKILVELAELSQKRYVSSFHVAVVYAGLRNNDEAFKSLNQAYEERTAELNFLRVDPRLDNLRSDPRFAELLRKMNL